MIKQLYIRNYVLVEEMTIDFSSSLTIITGETGAGKSILLDALALILGHRSDTSVVRDRENKCIVEGTFEVDRYDLNKFFLENDLDYNKETRIRREINAEGKSRAFINDTPVNLNILRSLAGRLIDIHSQHETLILNQSSFRFQVLDSFSGLSNELINYRKIFSAYKDALSELETLKTLESNLQKEKDFLYFQYEEISKLKLNPGELNLLQKESESLENAESIKSNLSNAFQILDSSENGILTELNKVKIQLSSVSKFSVEYDDLHKRINSVILECKELSRDLSLHAEKVDTDFGKLDLLNEKIDAILRLLKKHHLNSDQELIDFAEELNKKLESISTLKDQVLSMEKKSSQLLERVHHSAQRLSAGRKSSIRQFEYELGQLLLLLKMPSSVFKIELKETDTPDIYGMNQIEFYFSANAGNELRELHKVASGGELSRLMLCIKNLIANKTLLPTIVFDEIDTGVSGEVGAKIGWMLEEMAKGMQVISITHLPQIASRGEHHLLVKKREDQKKTFTDIVLLEKDKRVEEIAKMLSAGKITEASRQNAAELLQKRTFG